MTAPLDDRTGLRSQDTLGFDEDVWDALCIARLRYNDGSNKRTWWYVLRTYCNYTSGNSYLEQKVGRACDAWLAAHPSWKGRYTHL